MEKIVQVTSPETPLFTDIRTNIKSLTGLSDQISSLQERIEIAIRSHDKLIARIEDRIEQQRNILDFGEKI